MEEKSFRILLDLSEINIGESEVKYVWMFVSPRELKTIFDLKRAINKKIPLLQENYKLFLRDGLLLEDEKVSILREEDTIKLKLESFQQSLQEYSFRSVNEIVTDAHPIKRIGCDSCSSKGPKKRKSDIFISSGIESSSAQKKKKKKQDKSPQKSTIGNENVIDVTLNSIPNLSCVVTEPPKENNEKIFLSNKKKIDNITNNGEQLVKKDSKSKTNKNDSMSFTFNHSPQIEKSAVNESDLSVSNSQNIFLESESSRKEQKVEYDSKSKISRIKSASYYTFTPSPEIVKGVNVCESGLSFTETYPQIVNHENETLRSEVNLEANTPKQTERKKRKRRRKRKHQETLVTPESCVQTTPLESDIICDITHNTSEKRKHIIYKSPISSPKKIETATLDQDSITCSEASHSLSKEDMECTGLSELDMCVARFIEENKCEESVTRNQQNTLSSISDMSLKISTPFPKKKLKGQSWGITPLSGNSNTTSNTFIIEDCNTSKKETTFKSYTEYPSLNCLPQVGTRIAFKVLELNEKYCPEVTDYKEGIVRNIDPITDELTIELVQEEVKLGRTGKFENLKEDEIPPNEIIKTVILSWSALITPKLISEETEFQ